MINKTLYSYNLKVTIMLKNVMKIYKLRFNFQIMRYSNLLFIKISVK